MLYLLQPIKTKFAFCIIGIKKGGSIHEKKNQKKDGSIRLPSDRKQNPVSQHQARCHERRYQIVKVYALVDLKGRDIVSIFQSVSDDAAERSFLKLLTDGMPLVSDFPEDFAIFPVGELTVQNAALKVSEMGNENLAAAGFNVGTYTVTEPVKRGSEYDRRYLRMVAEDRGKVPSFGSSNAEEVKTDA